MNCEIREERPDMLHAYAAVSIAFEVRSVFDVEPLDDGLPVLSERRLEKSYVKDYDASEGCHPTLWPKRWDMSRWGFLAAFCSGMRVGGCAIVRGTEGVLRVHERRDAAVLWDLRVHPSVRGEGVGTRLFDAAAAWAKRQGLQRLYVETQNTNVSACRFYASRGCSLISAYPHAYAEFPEEVELIWRIALE